MSEILSASTVVTRKPHRCWGCGRRFPAKTEMTAVASKDMGSLTTDYWCETCESFMAAACHADDRFGDGDLRHNDEAEWEAHRAKVEDHRPEGRE